ncbi:PhzF family phenazine biosynthesis protein [Leucobacter rhizosphaerae]|uniref:PhzF family phenazine biosynthesis protein n=1 Tax=Leucobacter rhizosphaerae TaxID=2932245 RepID=A0ABY4FX12_9MICO|nr:PhzF family phenazine biosynthesis isomerase [Leucobacter rhizosphaerae]UOQ60836.1 PhzF family phenazine biosynthesis protein [Leucobacter rhizosphaerae]
MVPVIRSAAFTSDPSGGNPAGIVLDASEFTDLEMQGLATAVDYAETAFVTGADADGVSIRYFSPVAEVPFCGHATIATAIALVERGLRAPGDLTFRTPVGPVLLRTARIGGRIRAAFTSVEPSVEAMPPADLAELLALIGLTEPDLSADMPPALAFAGNVHPLLVLSDRRAFDTFAFDPDAARILMDAHGWPATITVLHGSAADGLVARNIFPVGRITEDPATGSAAAAVGAYLRALDLVEAPATIEIRQGAHVGRPSLLTVEIPRSGGITVSGTAVELPDPTESRL